MYFFFIIYFSCHVYHQHRLGFERLHELISLPMGSKVAPLDNKLHVSTTFTLRRLGLDRDMNLRSEAIPPGNKLEMGVRVLEFTSDSYSGH